MLNNSSILFHFLYPKSRNQNTIHILISNIYRIQLIWKYLKGKELLLRYTLVWVIIKIYTIFIFKILFQWWYSFLISEKSKVNVGQIADLTRQAILWPDEKKIHFKVPNLV